MDVRPSWTRPAWLAGLLLLCGCSQPLIPGAQLAAPPQGFGFDSGATSDRLVFTSRHVTDQRGYVLSGGGGEGGGKPGDGGGKLGDGGNRTSILITTYSGVATYEDMLEAWTSLEEERGEYGPLESMRLGKRDAWGWRVLRHEQDKVVSRKLVAILPDTKSGQTYTLEFEASLPEYMNETAMMKTLSSFTVKKSNVSLAKLGAVLALTAGFALVFRRARASLA